MNHSSRNQNSDTAFHDKFVHLYTFDFSWQAELLAHELESQNINAHLIFKPREYSQIIAGVVGDATEVFVMADQLAEAQKYLQSFLRDKNDQNDQSIQESQPVELMKVEDSSRFVSRVIIFSLLSLTMLPIVFNVVATINFKKIDKTYPKYKWVLLVLILGWLSQFFVLKWIWLE